MNSPDLPTRPKDLARCIESTLLRPDATEPEIIQLCEDAVRYGFRGVCVNPVWVPMVHDLLSDTPVKIVAVIAFPLGANMKSTKAGEASILAGLADEMDMVVNISALKAGRLGDVIDDIKAVVRAAKDVPVKVILEACLLTNEEIIAGCIAAKHAGAAWVKTSTGFSTGGATVEAVQLMRATVGDTMRIKASGGIRDYATAIAMLSAGADSLGTSNGPAIIDAYPA